MARLLTFLFAIAVFTAKSQTLCQGLKSLSLLEAEITAAEDVLAGTLPAHCRVAAVLTPSSDSHIEMEVWLPRADAWNGKYQAVGNGGWAGTITFGSGTPQPNARSMASALIDGYATSSNDTGHRGTGGDASFAQGHPEKLVDFAHRAVHEMTVHSKKIIAAYYGRAARLSYWNGCSTGGRQGLMAAQRYPDDFDGIIAGAPAANWTGLMTSFIWAAQAAHQGQPGNLPKEKLALLHDAVIKSCDGLDGVKDGLLEDPRRCKFDPKTLECQGSDGPACLTAPQVEAARRIYSGPINPRTKESIYPGMLPGSELGWDSERGLQPFGIGESYFRFPVFNNAAWDYRTMDFDNTVAKINQMHATLMNAMDTDLRRFFARGGKLLQYHGWDDQQISALNSLNYYLSVLQRMGDEEKIASSYRLFLAPGMMHCSNGAGPNQFNPIAVLEEWREKGIPPERIVASHVTGAVVDVTRPWCPYPQVAVYNGSGTIRDSANFTCKAPH
jgi:feruloyl esterase